MNKLESIVLIQRNMTQKSTHSTISLMRSSRTIKTTMYYAKSGKYPQGGGCRESWPERSTMWHDGNVFHVFGGNYMYKIVKNNRTEFLGSAHFIVCKLYASKILLYQKENHSDNKY